MTRVGSPIHKNLVSKKGTGIRIISSISKITKRIANKKKWTEKECRALWKGLNPHSYGLLWETLTTPLKDPKQNLKTKNTKGTKNKPNHK